MQAKPIIAATVRVPSLADTPLQIRTASLADLAYVADRTYAYRNRVGYYPAAAIEDHVRRGGVWLATLNDQPVGHVIVSGGIRVPAVLRVNCIEAELWERGLGTALTAEFVRWCASHTPHRLARVRTRTDIIAQSRINAATGGKIARIHTPTRSRRSLPIAEWHWPLPAAGGSHPQHPAAPPQNLLASQLALW